MRPIPTLARLAAGAFLAVALPPLGAQTAPKTGAEVFQRMHDAYAGKWYRTLRFVQKTTAYRQDGSAVIATWYESLKFTDAGVTQLRIDFGDPSAGNGTLYTADSTWVIRGGKVTATQPSGNEFLPLIEGVYLQPVSRTIAQLASTKVDMSRVTSAAWQKRPAWVIGVASAADSTSPQIWVDQERNVVVRMILAPAPQVPVMDVRLDDYVPLSGAWLATKIGMFIGGAPRQLEDYADWRANMDLPDRLFAISAWTSVPHWASR